MLFVAYLPAQDAGNIEWLQPLMAVSVRGVDALTFLLLITMIS